MLVALICTGARNKTVIKASSFPLVCVILAGFFAITTSSTIFAMTASDIVCKIRIIFTPMAILSVFGTLFLKTYRLKLIFTSGKKKKVRCNNEQILMGLGGMLFFQGLLFVLVDAHMVEKVTGVTNELEIVTLKECSLDPMASYGSIAYQFILYAWGAHVTWRVRTLPQTFNESNSIMICLVFILFYGAILLPLQVLVSDDQNALALLRGLGIQFGVWVCLGAFFLPKILTLWAKIMADRASRSGLTGKTSRLTSKVGSDAAGGRRKSAVGGDRQSLASNLESRLSGIEPDNTPFKKPEDLSKRMANKGKKGMTLKLAEESSILDSSVTNLFKEAAEGKVYDPKSALLKWVLAQKLSDNSKRKVLAMCDIFNIEDLKQLCQEVPQEVMMAIDPQVVAILSRFASFKPKALAAVSIAAASAPVPKAATTDESSQKRKKKKHREGAEPDENAVLIDSYSSDSESIEEPGETNGTRNADGSFVVWYPGGEEKQMEGENEEKQMLA